MHFCSRLLLLFSVKNENEPGEEDVVKSNLAAYRQRFHLEGAIFERFSHEDATVADVYKITVPAGHQLVLKICVRADDYERELFYLRRFAGGVVPVPHIIDCEPPASALPGGEA